MHPIIPVPDIYVGYPIAYAEALAAISKIGLGKEIAELVGAAAGSAMTEHERLLLMTLAYGDLAAFVFSTQERRWGRLPAGFWAWQGGLESPLARGVFAKVTSPLLSVGLDDASAFEGSPIMLMQDAVDAFGDNLAAASDQIEEGAPKPLNPITTMATIVRCKAWLIEQFQDQGTAPMTRDAFREAAQDLFEDLSKRSFLHAWGEATEGYPERSRAGRRKN